MALAERMLATTRQLQSNPSPDEKTRLHRKIAVIDRRIDEFPYQLYGFGDADVAVVETAGVGLLGAIATSPLE